MTTTPAPDLLPNGMQVFERGWLSSNNILLHDPQGMHTALIDSGYCTHAAHTIELVRHALHAVPADPCQQPAPSNPTAPPPAPLLNLLANTHLHSDHCGGNAALQSAFSGLRTFIPPGQALEVDAWDTSALSYEPTGQRCPRFQFEAVLVPGQLVQLGERGWRVHVAPGHDPHSVILFEPESQTLISADALWENGFGVVFPELEGESAFDDVEETLELIASLEPKVVIPGHGRAFHDVAGALQRAHERLAAQRAAPDKHAQHAAKVLIKYHMLEFQSRPEAELLDWIDDTALFHVIHDQHFASQAYAAWRTDVLNELIQKNVLSRLDTEKGVIIKDA